MARLRRPLSVCALLALLVGPVAAAPLQEGEAEAAPAAEEEVEEALEEGILGRVNRFLAPADDAAARLNGKIAAVLFWDLWFWDDPDGSLGGRVQVDGPHPAGATTLALATGPKGKYELAAGDTVAIDEHFYRVVEATPEVGASGTGTVTIEPGLAVAAGGGEAVQLWNRKFPFAVAWLIFGALFFTVRMGFVNVRAFGHAIAVTRGRYDDPNDQGEVSHFKALSTALSATVGLGNIAGVAIAISIGGPGATFWMIVAGLLGMSSKFTECTLGQQFREVRPDGHVMGGAMHYLSKGLREMRLAPLGYVLAVLFAIMCIGGSLGGGNSFQVNQSLNALKLTIPQLGEFPWIYGLFMTLMVGIVIIGGIRRIAGVASAIVPSMCVIYVLMALLVIAVDYHRIPWAFGRIVHGAFSPDALYGGIVGVLITGFQRAAFSNEAGIGSAAIAHSAARTKYPVREGIVALLEPFIDTVVICTMTALVIVVTGAYENEADLYVAAREGSEGATLTSLALGELRLGGLHVGIAFRYILAAAVMLFAYSTMISWSYYGERCWAWMFGERSSLVYKLLFLVFVFLGSIVASTNVLEFGDLMILGMAIPNILGVLLLSGRVRRELDAYWGKLKRGELPVYE